ncbi:MAG: hypothetical protein NC355_09085 [Blautia sp.]|nr:hypothetical protein [Blautia sp.]
MSEMETNETKPVAEQPQAKPRRERGAWMVVVAVVLLIGMLGSIAVSAFTLGTLKTFIAKMDEEENPETTEDYVKIADQYEILPTTEISDAYKSGDTSKLDDKQKETLDMAKAALEEMEIKDDMSDYEKEKAVYDWMTTSLQQDRGALTVIPRTQEDCDNPYGVLKYHNAVCVGYATTFRMFMHMLDIECMVEHNTERYHSWNLVKLDDDWYITDIYSDAGQNNYAHFNMTDAMQEQQQNWDRDFFPAADSLKYNMAYQNKIEVEDIYDIVDAMRQAMNDQLGAVMIGFKQEIKDEDARVASSIASTIDNLLMANNYQDMPYYLSTYHWIQDPEDDRYLFCVYMGNYNTQGVSQELSPEEMTKIQELVNKAFEDLAPAGVEAGIDEAATDTAAAGLGTDEEKPETDEKKPETETAAPAEEGLPETETAVPAEEGLPETETAVPAETAEKTVIDY